MIVRRFPRRFVKKSYTENPQLRPPKKIAMSDTVALQPTNTTESFADHNFQVPYPKEMVNYLNKFVIGQELAKRTLAVGVYQHYKRLQNNTEIQTKQLLKDAVDASVYTKERKKSSENEEFDELFDAEAHVPRRKTTYERLKEEVW